MSNSANRPDPLGKKPPKSSNSKSSHSLSSSSFDDLPEAVREYPIAPKPRRKIPVWVLMLVAAIAIAILIVFSRFPGTLPVATPRPNPTTSPTAAADGRMLNHYPYPEVAASELEPINGDSGIRLRKSAAQAYQSMNADAQAAGITLVPLSAFRSVQEQEEVFFGVKQERVQTVRERAGVSAPPGYSEHHTGYALDIGDGAASGSHLSTDFENTEAFKWLEANAPKYSFELSFPKNNTQGVNYEPWHWRYVGDSASLEMFFKAKNK